jgi:hypothetical protein
MVRCKIFIKEITDISQIDPSFGKDLKDLQYLLICTANLTNLDRGSEMIIFESILITFIASVIFSGR